MMGLIIFIQSLCCLLLVIVILMQSGRGGGLTDAFASAETMFGAKTNEVLVRTTVVLAAIFLVSNLFLVHLSSRRESSLFTQMGKVKRATSSSKSMPANLPLTNAVADTK